MPPPTLEELAQALKNEVLVTLDVNPDTEAHCQYKVQRTVLASASPWFDKALNGDWTESKELKLAFRDVDTNVIEQFLYFVIRGDTCLSEHDTQHGLLAVKLWVFADKHLLPKLQNHVMRYLHGMLGPLASTGFEDISYPSTEAIAEALETSAPESALYTFMMALLTEGLNDGSSYAEPGEPSYNIGQYNSAELEVLERIPGLTTRLLFEAMKSEKIIVHHRLEQLLVKED